MQKDKTTVGITINTIDTAKVKASSMGTNIMGINTKAIYKTKNTPIATNMFHQIPAFSFCMEMTLGFTCLPKIFVLSAGESGVIGPFSNTQTTATITFRGTFVVPPSISLSLSDLTTTAGGTAVSVQIRPSSVTTTTAGVTFSAAPTNNVASAFVSYMVCPSNASPAVTTGTATSGLLG
ncbi:hypothetical protein ElyMa_001937700 [Elysia marginata]|uniref:H-type lectin domain-containing protein n=1 Tax=Elysia marginata TaxID=1093978 RepID=A0AAV4EW93_9GAST|nr:hypothetical protein ElyMa_001937700 [Elysia marginata]